MASANAIAKMACTRIFCDAPGFRTTASEAFMPMKPTPIAAPSAANPTCRLPVISANTGIRDIYVYLSLLSQRLPRLNTVKPPKFSMVGSFVPFLVLANQHGENRRQQHEHERLNDSYEQFHEIKRHRNDHARERFRPRRLFYQIGHRFQHVFAGENISIKPKAEGNRTKENRKHLQKTNRKEDDDEQDLQSSARFSLWCEQMFEKPDRSVALEGPDDPAGEENHGHCESHIEVRVSPAQPWVRDAKPIFRVGPPTDRSQTRN